MAAGTVTLNDRMCQMQLQQLTAGVVVISLCLKALLLLTFWQRDLWQSGHMERQVHHRLPQGWQMGHLCKQFWMLEFKVPCPSEFHILFVL
jgi:hypothetical protein